MHTHGVMPDVPITQFDFAMGHLKVEPTHLFLRFADWTSEALPWNMSRRKNWTFEVVSMQHSRFAHGTVEWFPIKLFNFYPLGTHVLTTTTVDFMFAHTGGFLQRPDWETHDVECSQLFFLTAKVLVESCRLHLQINTFAFKTAIRPAEHLGVPNRILNGTHWFWRTAPPAENLVAVTEIHKEHRWSFVVAPPVGDLFCSQWGAKRNTLIQDRQFPAATLIVFRSILKTHIESEQSYLRLIVFLFSTMELKNNCVDSRQLFFRLRICMSSTLFSKNTIGFGSSYNRLWVS